MVGPDPSPNQPPHYPADRPYRSQSKERGEKDQIDTYVAFFAAQQAILDPQFIQAIDYPCGAHGVRSAARPQPTYEEQQNRRYERQPGPVDHFGKNLPQDGTSPESVDLLRG